MINSGICIHMSFLYANKKEEKAIYCIVFYRESQWLERGGNSGAKSLYLFRFTWRILI